MAESYNGGVPGKSFTFAGVVEKGTDGNIIRTDDSGKEISIDNYYFLVDKTPKIIYVYGKDNNNEYLYKPIDDWYGFVTGVELKETERENPDDYHEYKIALDVAGRRSALESSNTFKALKDKIFAGNPTIEYKWSESEPSTNDLDWSDTVPDNSEETNEELRLWAKIEFSDILDGDNKYYVVIPISAHSAQLTFNETSNELNLNVDGYGNSISLYPKISQDGTGKIKAQLTTNDPYPNEGIEIKTTKLYESLTDSEYLKGRNEGTKQFLTIDNTGEIGVSEFGLFNKSDDSLYLGNYNLNWDNSGNSSNRHESNNIIGYDGVGNNEEVQSEKLSNRMSIIVPGVKNLKNNYLSTTFQMLPSNGSDIVDYEKLITGIYLVSQNYLGNIIGNFFNNNKNVFSIDSNPSASKDVYTYIAPSLYGSIVYGGNNKLLGEGEYFGNLVVGVNNTITENVGTCMGKTVLGNLGTLNTDNQILVIGNGERNCLEVYRTGMESNGGYGAIGQDYAEYFEWFDKNLNCEDRVGLFVTFEEGNKIRIANSSDTYILGIISGSPSVLGNSDMSYWSQQFLKDDFGRYIYEDVTKEISTPKTTLDEEGNEVITYETTLYTEKQFVSNPEYNPDLKYIRRSERPEWAPVGMLGVLSVYDDGTCIPGGFCKVADGGIATHDETNSGYKVLYRVKDNIIKVVFR